MIVHELSEFLARSTDQDFEDLTLAKVLADLPALAEKGPWLAGGALRRTMLGQEPASDFDFFFADPDQLSDFKEALEAKGFALARETDHHLHFKGKAGGVERDVQLIRFQFYTDAASVIDSFDFTICQFAFDGSKVTCGDYALWDLGRKRLAIHKLTYPTATMRRLIKYTSQGFNACSGALTAILKRTVEDPALHSQLDIAYVD